LRFFLIIETVGVVFERQSVGPQYGKSLSEKIAGKRRGTEDGASFDLERGRRSNKSPPE
jgi:hypothetical protein